MLLNPSRIEIVSENPFFGNLARYLEGSFFQHLLDQLNQIEVVLEVDLFFPVFVGGRPTDRNVGSHVFSS